MNNIHPRRGCAWAVAAGTFFQGKGREKLFVRAGVTKNPVWLAVLALSVTLAALACFAAGEAGNTIATVNPAPTDPAQTYRDFLSDPPWIKRISYRQDRNYFHVGGNSNKPGTPLQGYARYEAGIQPAGYYRKHLEGAVTRFAFGHEEPPDVAGRGITGASEKYFWRIWEGDGHVTIVPRSKEEGASPNNWLNGFFRFEMLDLKLIQTLGLDQLTDATIVWVDKDHFTARSAAFGPAHGTILHYLDGLPSEVAYSFVAFTNYYYLARYTYKSGTPFPPYQIVVLTKRDGAVEVCHTNYIDELEVGLDPAAADGYSAAEFRVENTPFNRVQYSSNAVLYEIDLKGRMHAVDTTYRPIASLNPGGSWIAITAPLISVAVAVGAVFLFLRTKKHGANKTARK